MKLLVLVTLLIVLVCQIFAETPAFLVGINSDGMNKMVNRVLPGVINQVQSISIPEESGKASGFKYSISNVHFKSLNIGNFHMATNNGLHLSISGVDVAVGLKWSYKQAKISVPKGSGTADINLHDGDVAINLALTVQQTPEGLKPAIVVQNVSCNIKSFKVKVHKSIFSWLYNIILSVVKNKMRKIVEDTVRDGLSAGITAASASILATLPTRAAIGTFGSINYGLTGPATYISNSLVVPFNGDIGHLDGTPSGISKHGITLNPKGRLFEIAMDTSVFQSAFRTAFIHHAYAPIISEMNAGKIPRALSTEFWYEIIPGLRETLPNAPMRIVSTLADEPIIAAVPQSLKMSLFVGLKFQGQTPSGEWKNLFTVRLDSIGAVNVVINNQVILPSISIESNKFSITETIFGDIPLTPINNVLQFITDVFVVPGINSALMVGIPIPLVNGISLSNTNFEFGKDVIMFSTDMEYNL